MATTQDFADFIRDQFSGLEGLVLRRMFGEYGIYYHGHIIGFLCDNRLLFQDVPSARRLLPGAKVEPLFPGSKDFLIPDEVDNGRFLCEVAEAICEECPVPKPRKPAGGRAQSSRQGNEAASSRIGRKKSQVEPDIARLDPEIRDFLDFHRNK